MDELLKGWWQGTLGSFFGGELLWEVRYVEKPMTDRTEGLSKLDLSKDYPGSQDKVWKAGI